MARIIARSRPFCLDPPTCPCILRQCREFQDVTRLAENSRLDLCVREHIGPVEHAVRKPNLGQRACARASVGRKHQASELVLRRSIPSPRTPLSMLRFQPNDHRPMKVRRYAFAVHRLPSAGPGRTRPQHSEATSAAVRRRWLMNRARGRATPRKPVLRLRPTACWHPVETGERSDTRGCLRDRAASASRYCSG
jgi:hypothetical protein